MFLDPPENTTTKIQKVEVVEGFIPPHVICEAKAYPDPSFEWRRNGEVIATGNALIINTAMKQSDRGTYTCFSFNKHGNQSTDIEMDVQCKYRKSIPFSLRNIKISSN